MDGNDCTQILREWAPLTEIINQIPIKLQTGLFSKYISVTCVDAIPEFLALGTNIGTLFWYNRKHGQFEKFKCESCSDITCIRIASTVDYMVACGHENGQISIFQIPKSYPDCIPDSLKSQCTRKLERYTVTEIHSASISSLEWTKNGMKLFSGDKNGLVVLTELDFSMHICKELEIVNESYEIVQISYCNQYLLISTTYRSIICHRQDDKWKVCQVGKKDRKNLGKFGGIFVKTGLKPNDITAYCSRPGLRIWVADINGTVQRTLLFKDLITSDIPEIPLLNPISESLRQLKCESECMFGRLLYFNNKYLVTYESNIVYILDPENLVVLGAISQLRGVLSVACNKDEIFILEGERSLIRIAFNPEFAEGSTNNAIPQATLFLPISNSIKDFTSKFQSANILAAIPTFLEPNPTITECSIETDTTAIVNAEEAVECLSESSPVKETFEQNDDNLSNYVEKIMTNSQNIAQMVANLITNNGTGTVFDKNMYVSKFESPRHVRSFQKDAIYNNGTSEECLRKLELYEKIGEQNFDNDILFKHTRRKKPKKQSNSNTPEVTPRMTNSCYDVSNKKVPPVQPLNISMIEIPTDFSIKPDLRSPDSIQNDIKNKEKLLSDVLYYTKPVQTKEEPDTSENGDDVGNRMSRSKVQQNGSANSVTKPKPVPKKETNSIDKNLQMPVWVQAPSKPPQTSSGMSLIKRIKQKALRTNSDVSNSDLTNNLEELYKDSYDPDDYLRTSPKFGFPQQDLTDGSDVSLTDWEIL